MSLEVEDVLIVIRLMSEPRKPLPIKPDRQLAVVRQQHINPQVKLLPSEKQWLINILLNYISFALLSLLLSLLLGLLFGLLL